MLRIGTLSLVALAAVLGSCEGSDSKPAPHLKGSTIPAAPGPTGPSGPTSSKRSATRPSPDETSPADAGAFDVSSVRVSFLEKSYFGAKSQVVYFVMREAAIKAGQTPLEQAEACVGHYLRKAPSAYCYAFSSQRAFGFSRVSRHPPAKMQRPCWSAYWGKPNGRRPIGADTNAAALALHCPGATG
jgi:hypothetical protein